jgi:hypothetical protein
MQMHLQMTAPHELACYTMNKDGTDGCHVCFVAREVSAGGNAIQLDGAIISICAVFTSDHYNRSMRHLFHHNRGYAHAKIVKLSTTDA